MLIVIRGLVIIGYTPRNLNLKKNVDNVKTALQTHNIEYPIAIDNGLDADRIQKSLLACALSYRSTRPHCLRILAKEVCGNENNIRYLLGLSHS